MYRNMHRKAIIKNKNKKNPKQHKLPTYISINVENVHSSQSAGGKIKCAQRMTKSPMVPQKVKQRITT